jgi:hypothetical protein
MALKNKLRVSDFTMIVVSMDILFTPAKIEVPSPAPANCYHNFLYDQR